MNDTVDEVIRVAAAEGIDADIKKGGEFTVAYTPAQEKRIREFAASEAKWKSADVHVFEAETAKAKINVANTRVAVWHPHSARIQPAKLVSGLADAVERAGVEIYENTRVEKYCRTRLSPRTEPCPRSSLFAPPKASPPGSKACVGFGYP